MSIKKTLLMAVVFMAAVAFYLWDRGRVEQVEMARIEQGRLIKATKKNFQAVEIKNASGALRLELQDGQWWLTAPRHLRTDSAKVSGLLGPLDQTIRADAFDRKDTPLENFGLSPAVATVSVESSPSQELTVFELGSPTPDGQRVYARMLDSDEIFMVPAGLGQQAALSADALRDRRTVPVNLNRATQLELTFAGQTIRARREGESWLLTEPLVAPADDDAVGELLRAWDHARAREFLPTTGTLDLAAYGLDEPAWQGSALAPDDKGEPTSVTLRVGGLADVQGGLTRWAWAQGSDEVFELNQSVLEPLRPTADDLRSKQLFTLNPDRVDKVDFQVRGAAFALQKDSGGQWRLAGEPATRLDQSIVKSKLVSLLRVRAQRFFDQGAPVELSGLDSPNLSVSVQASTQTQTLQTGRKDAAEDFVYASFDGRIIGLDWTVPGQYFLTRDDLLDKSMFDFDVELVTRVDLTLSSSTLTLTRERPGHWAAKTATGEQTIDVAEARVQALVFSALSLQWKRALDPGQSTDLTLIKTQTLENPPLVMTFFDAASQQLGSLGQGGQAGNLTYFTRNGTDYFAVETARVATLKRAVDDLSKIEK